jgi:signal transduction histidine kinase
MSGGAAGHYIQVEMEIVRDTWDRLRTIPPLVQDSALAVVLSVAAVVEFRLYHAGLSTAPGLDTHMVAVLLFTLPLAIRRNHPLVMTGLQIAGSALILAQPPYTAIFAALIGLYSLCVYGPTPWLGLVWLLIGVISLQFGLPGIYMQVAPAMLLLLSGTVAWLGGQATRGRLAQSRILQDRAQRLERERDLAAQVAVADERARIARDLHDVVAHSVSLIVVQAGAARMVRGQPPRAVAALRNVEASGRQALEELRHLVGLLGPDQEASDLAPQPGLDQLETLAATVRSAGLPVQVYVSGSRREVPPGLDLTAYRIIQEALTNTLKHAPGASAEVHVDFGDRELGVDVLDSGGKTTPTSALSGGHGLTGMRERVALYRGSLEAGPRAEGGFGIRARLPLEPA